MAGSLVALLMPASLLMVSATTSADAADTPLNTTNARKAKAKGKATLVALPQIVQQGKKPAPAPVRPRPRLTATIKPAQGRSPRRPAGARRASKWKTVSKTKLAKKGLAEFGAPISKGGKALTYRVTAAEVQGREGRAPASRSAPSAG